MIFQLNGFVLPLTPTRATQTFNMRAVRQQQAQQPYASTVIINPFAVESLVPIHASGVCVTMSGNKQQFYFFQESQLEPAGVEMAVAAMDELKLVARIMPATVFQTVSAFSHAVEAKSGGTHGLHIYKRNAANPDFVLRAHVNSHMSNLAENIEKQALPFLTQIRAALAQQPQPTHQRYALN